MSLNLFVFYYLKKRVRKAVKYYSTEEMFLEYKTNESSIYYVLRQGSLYVPS